MNLNLGPSEQVKGSKCPYCGYFLDGVTGLSEGAVRGPAEGDFTICAMCCELLIFGKELELHKLSEEDMKRLKGEAELYQTLKKVQQAAKMIRMQRNFEEAVEKWKKK